MKAIHKKRITLTINIKVLEKTQKLLLNSNESLSSIVEKYLKSLTSVSSSENWITNFHKKYLNKAKPNSDKNITKILDDRVKQYQ